MARIFLCHASEDKPRVEEVYRRLHALGWQPWMDKMDLLPGQWWQEEIPRALRASDFILIFFSRNSVAQRKGYVQREFKLAIDTLQEIPSGMIHIIPIRLDDCAIPSEFGFLQWCDFFEEDGFERIVQAIRVGLLQRQHPEWSVLREEPVLSEILDHENHQTIKLEAQRQEEAECARQQELQAQHAREEAERVRQPELQKRRNKEDDEYIESRSLQYLSPATFIKAAQAAHPAFKYAIVVAGLAAIVTVVLRFGASSATLVFGGIIIVVLMVLFLVFAQASAVARVKVALPALVLIWSFLSIAIATAVFLFTSAFFDIPLPLKTAIIRSASNLQDFSRGVVQQNPTPPNSTRAEIPPNDLTHRVPIRVALVIGNNDYPMGRLRNAVSDAEAVSKKLESKGFQILYRPNATRNVMLTAIEHFKIFLALGGIGIVYYSGHGAHFRDSDYMVPIDIPPDINALNFTQHAVNLTELLRPIDKIISNTPESSGDAIMYATASDSVAMDGVDNHSPFAHALLDALSQKSIELSDIFRFVSTETLKRSGGIQTPWLSSSFNKYFHFDDRNYDMSIGILKILFFDTCRNNPFKEASR